MNAVAVQGAAIINLEFEVNFDKEKVLNEHRCILVVTHDARINEYADRIVHMEDGRITGLDKGTQ